MAPAITFHDVTRRYGDLVAVDHLSFDVAPGEPLSILHVT